MIGIAYVQDRPVSELRELWKRIDDMGFDNMWVGDHVRRNPQMGPLLECFSLLGAITACTSRVRIGPLVVNISYRNPAVVAKQAITLDALSGGRLDFGIGAGGTYADDALVAGVDDWSPSERIARLEEFVEMAEGLLSGRLGDYDGRFYRTKGFERGDWPVQTPRPPIVIAAQGPKALRVAARFADTWNVLGGWGRQGDELVSFVSSSNALLDGLAEQVGRRSTDIRRSLLVGKTGTDWWSSGDDVRRLIDTFSGSGIQDFVFSAPHLPGGTKSVGAFLDVVEPILSELSS